MKNKKWMAVSMSALMMLGLMGCGNQAASTTETASSGNTAPTSEAGSSATDDKDEITVGYTVQSMENAYFVSIINGMKAAAEEKGVNLIISDAGGDASKHVNHIEDFISQGVDAIIISPVDEQAPKDAVAKAEKEGIPVISFCQNVEGSDAFYGTSEKEYGIMGGNIVGEWLNEKEADGTIDQVLDDDGKIEVVVARYDTASSVIARGDGLKEGLESTYTGTHAIEYVLEQDASDADSGYQLVETALTSHPQANVFMSINDSAALGMYEAILTHKEHTTDNTCVQGLDALPEALKLISENTMYIGTVDLAPEKQGATVLDIVKDVLKDGPIKDQIVAEMTPVTKANISEYDVEN